VPPPGSGRAFSASTSPLAWLPASRWNFQFGTNWAAFSQFSGNIIGQTLAMEECSPSSWKARWWARWSGEKRLGPRNHFLATVGVALGSWISGYFILSTNAFMQHPAGYSVAADGTLRLENLTDFLLNPWAWVMCLHNQSAALVTGSFAVAAVGAFFALRRKHLEQASLFLKISTAVGLVSSVFGRLSHRRYAGENGGQAPTRGARGHGGPLP